MDQECIFIRCCQLKGVCVSVHECVCEAETQTYSTLKVFEVNGISTSGGMSKPGGHGIEKLLVRNWPLIASSTSLSIDTTKTTTNHSSAMVRRKRNSTAIPSLNQSKCSNSGSSITPLSAQHFLEGHLRAVQSELPVLQSAQRIRHVSCNRKKKKRQTS